MRIVVLGCETVTAEILRFILVQAGYDVLLSSDADELLAMMVGGGVDCVILQGEPPGLDSCKLAVHIRGRGFNGPLLILSRHTSTSDKVRAFEHGADDFLAVPYDPIELLARIDAIIRRCQRIDHQPLGSVLKVGDVQLFLGESAVKIGDGERIPLTLTEMRILECLMRNCELTISRQRLIERTWGYDFYGESNRVDVYVSRLRKKLECDPSHPRYLVTVRGIGYAFRSPAEIFELAIDRSMSSCSDSMATPA